MSEIEVDVYQGEDRDCGKNELVGSFVVKGLQEVDGSNKIVATFALDINGMLEVTALEKDTGLKKTVTLDTKNIDNNFDLAESREKLAQFELLDDGESKKENEVSDEKSNREVKALFSRFEKLDKEELDNEDLEEVQELMAELKSAVQNKAIDLIQEKSKSISDLLFYLED